MWRRCVTLGVLAAATACSDGGGSLAPSGTSASLGSSGSSTASTTPADTSGTTSIASTDTSGTGTGTGLLAGVIDPVTGLVNGVVGSATSTTTGTGTTSTVTGLVNGVTGTVTNTTQSLLGSNGLSVATGTATNGGSGQPLLNGALLKTDGLIGTGTTGLLSTSTTTPNGTTNTAALNVPTPILANTQVLPSGANGGALIKIGGSNSPGGTTSSSGGLVSGLLGSNGLLGSGTH